MPDPPDVTFHVASERWAVEVTRLFQYFDDSGKATSREAVDRPLRVLCRNLQDYAAKHAPGKGFFLYAAGPTAPSIKTIEKRGEAFITSGRVGPEALDDRGVITIEARPQSLELIAGHGLRPDRRTATGDKVAADIGQNIRDALTKAVGSKAPRMNKLVGYDRKVLLLVNEYPLAEGENVRAGYAQMRSPAFDAVVFVDSGNAVYVVDDPQGLFPPQPQRSRRKTPWLLFALGAVAVVAVGTYLYRRNRE